jgi:hypothetical protein
LNTFQTYQLDTLSTPDIGTKLVIAWTGQIAQPAAAKALVVGGYCAAAGTDTDFTIRRGAGIITPLQPIKFGFMSA